MNKLPRFTTKEKLNLDQIQFIKNLELEKDSLLALQKLFSILFFHGWWLDLKEKIYNIFAKEGLNIPFLQMDVHIQK